MDLLDYRRMLILAEGQFGVLESKTATCLLRYRGGDVVAIIDSTRAGWRTGEVVGVGGETPIVAGLEEGLGYQPDSLVIGVAPRGGRLPEDWRPMILEALEAGLDVLTGLHTFLGDDPQFREVAERRGCRLWDLRQPPADIPVATCLAAEVPAKVVLTVGSDCDVGKMTVAFELCRGASVKGLRTAVVATGQTGLLLTGRGIVIDRVPSDFVAGAAERLVLEAGRDADLVVVEGQGSLIHPGYSGVTLGLMHGAMPDGLILCHHPGRSTVKDYPGVPMPSLPELIALHDEVMKPVKSAPVVGVALNTFDLDEAATQRALAETRRQTNLPVIDPIKFGADLLVEAIEELPLPEVKQTVRVASGEST